MNILLLEDDSAQRATLHESLTARYLRAKVKCIGTESEFYYLLDEIEKGQLEPPNVVIADDMVPWETLTRDSTPPPAAIEKDGFSRAGIRCLMKFRAALDVPIPWIMFSILEPETIIKDIVGVPYRDKVTVISKERSLEHLFDAIDRLLAVAQD